MMPGRNAEEIAISVQSELRDAVAIAIERFRVESDERELNFPSSLSTVERAYIHRVARSLGYVSRSRGRGAQRAVTIYKVSIANLLANRATFDLSHNSRLVTAQLAEGLPLQSRERRDLQPRTERDQPSVVARGEMQKTITARLNSGVAQVPERRAPGMEGIETRYAALFAKRGDLLKLINEARCVLVVGEPGLGKSTQISQLIMDDAAASGRACRLIQSVPYRALAMRLAERVAADRGENVVGNAVGYQVRLASRVSPCTVLTFCTNGVLLRTMMNSPMATGGNQQAVASNEGGGALCTATHIIVDELQVRDRFGDFALACLRDFVNKYRNVKLVLIAAPSVNAQAIVTYFNNTQCHLLQLAKRPSGPVRELFLDGVLDTLRFRTAGMRVAATQLSASQRRVQTLQSWLVSPSLDKQAESAGDAELDSLVLRAFCGHDAAVERFYVLLAVRLGGAPPDTDAFWPPIANGDANVDYAHSITGVTMLHAVCVCGWLRHAEYLLNIGANPFVRAANGWTALDFANRFDQRYLADFLEARIVGCCALVNEEYDSLGLLNLNDERVSAGFEQLANENVPATIEANGDANGVQATDLALVAYQRSLGPFVRIDYELIVALLRHIESTNSARRSTLVFLPSVDEIASLRNRLASENLAVFAVHEAMQPHELAAANGDGPKILLANELAESCVTFPNIGFVIDTGVNLERAFQPVADFTYSRYAFISKGDAALRKQRLADASADDALASSQPTIFRLYSKRRFEKLRPQRLASLLRSNLLDVGLYTKLLAPTNFPIADFLAKTIEAPLFAASRNAVHALKQLDALDAFEELTELGYHLLDLPLDARYSKMIVLSVVLKCVDPILTVACFLGVRNPFLDESWNSFLYQGVSTSSHNDCATAVQRRHVKETLAAQSNSDHMVLLRAFQLWQKAKEDGNEQRFCAEHLLSPSALELVLARRAQVLQQLRASGFVRARSNGDLRDLNANSENWAVVKAAIVGACYPQLVRLDRVHRRLLTAQHSDVRFAPSSTLARLPWTLDPPTDSDDCAFRVACASEENTHDRLLDLLPSEWLVYDQLSHATGLHVASLKSPTHGDGKRVVSQPLSAAKPRQIAVAQCCTVVSAITVALFAGPSRLASLDKLLCDLDADAHGEPVAPIASEADATDADADADSGSLFEDDDAGSLAASFLQLRANGLHSAGDESRRRKTAVLHIDDLIRFELDPDVGRLIAQLRAKWQALLVRRLRSPSRPCNPSDDSILHAIVAVLTSEEQASGLQQPSGIGQRPRPSAAPQSADLRPRSGSFGFASAYNELRRASAEREDDFGSELYPAAQSASPHGSSASNSSGDLLGDTLVSAATHHASSHVPEFVPQALAAHVHRSAQNFAGSSRPQAVNPAVAAQAAALRQQAAQRAAAPFAAAEQQRLAAQHAAGLSRFSATATAAAVSQQQQQQQQQQQMYYAMLAAALKNSQTQSQAMPSGDVGMSVRYFVMKGADASLLDASAETGLWPVEPNTARKLRLSARESRGVLLVFMLQSSGVFYGYATLTEPPGSPPPLTVAQALELGECPAPFACFVHYELLRLDWLCFGVRLPFNATNQLAISASDNRKVYLARDGQELDPAIGSKLLQLIRLCASAASPQVQAARTVAQPPQVDYALLANAMQNLDVGEQQFADANAEFAAANMNSFGLGMGLPFSGAGLRPSAGFPRPPPAAAPNSFRSAELPFAQSAQFRAAQPYANLGANWQRMPF